MVENKEKTPSGRGFDDLDTVIESEDSNGENPESRGYPQSEGRQQNLGEDDDELFEDPDWISTENPDSGPETVNVYNRRSVKREEIEPIVEALVKEHQNTLDGEDSAMNTNQGPVEEILSNILLERPETVLYGIGLAFLMYAVYLSSAIVAISGVGLLFITILHYGD